MSFILTFICGTYQLSHVVFVKFRILRNKISPLQLVVFFLYKIIVNNIYNHIIIILICVTFYIIIFFKKIKLKSYGTFVYIYGGLITSSHL